MELSKELQTAIDAAKKGAQTALSYYNTPLDFELKSDDTPVSLADRNTEEVIKKSILESYPSAKFLAEESGGSNTEEEFWIIDPIDGTSSFRREIPFWAILISLYKNGEIVLGVAYFPVLNELLFAEKGKGAYRNGERIHVSDEKDLNKAYIAYSNPKHFQNQPQLLTLIAATHVARSPEPSLAATFVASGRYDGLVDKNAKLWDTTAHQIIIKEAGGTITNMQGGQWTFSDKGYIASNGFLHEQITEKLK